MGPTVVHDDLYLDRVVPDDELTGIFAGTFEVDADEVGVFDLESFDPDERHRIRIIRRRLTGGQFPLHLAIAADVPAAAGTDGQWVGPTVAAELARRLGAPVLLSVGDEATRTPTRSPPPTAGSRWSASTCGRSTIAPSWSIDRPGPTS